MADINIGKAPPNSAVLPFYATGAIAFCVLCLLLFLSPGSLATHYFNPHLLAIVHTAALGWATMIIFGAAHQLLPVVCERDLFSPAIASLCWYTLTAGVLLLVFSFWDFRTGWFMIGGGILIMLSVLAYFINALLTSRLCAHYSIARLFIVTSAAWLLITAVAGLLLAVNLAYPFFDKSHLEILKLHAHAGLAGWFLQLVTGISSKLVPMFLLGKSGKEKLLQYACILQNAGLLLFLCDGYFWGIAAFRALLYAALVLAGVICWLLYLQDAYRHRVRKSVDAQMKHTFISFLCLLAGLLLLPVILYAQGSRWTVLYGALLFMGWLTGIILGKTFKTLPFIVWNGHYKALSGKVKVPLPKHLYSEALVQWQLRIYIAGIAALAAGIVLNEIIVIRLASAVWLLLSFIYLYNVLKILLHKTKVLS
jgi:hypothetical protein